MIGQVDLRVNRALLTSPARAVADVLRKERESEKKYGQIYTMLSNHTCFGGTGGGGYACVCVWFCVANYFVALAVIVDTATTDAYFPRGYVR